MESQAKVAKRSLALAACGTCRSRKVACDARRPKCSRCLKRGDECNYSTRTADETRSEALKRENVQLKARLEQLADRLKGLDGLPDELILHMVRGACAALDPLEAFRELRQVAVTASGPAPQQPSTPSLESMLHERHPLWYPVVPFYGKDQHRAAFFVSRPKPASTVVDTRSRCHCATCPRGKSGPNTSPLAPCCETCYRERLQPLHIQTWTSVPIDDALAVDALAEWLSNSHSTFACFDPDLFITDLLAGRQEFCSKPMLNALMYTACKGGVWGTGRASTYSHAFRAEAEALLSAPSNDAPLHTTVAALLLHSLGLLCDEESMECLQYMSRAKHSCAGLTLPSSPAGKEAYHDPRLVRATSYAAWSVFVTCGQAAFLLRNIEAPAIPKFPLPDATAGHLDVIQHDIVSNDIFSLYSLPKTSDHARTSLPFAEASFHRLLAWADHFALYRERDSDNMPGFVHLRMLYHVMVMDVFRPFIMSDDPLASFRTLDNHPRAAFEASSKQLQYAVLTFRHDYVPMRASFIWVSGLVYVSNEACRAADRSAGRQILTSCVSILLDQSVYFRYAGNVARGMMSMALRRRLVSTEEARLVDEKVAVNERNHQASLRAGTLWVLDLDRAGARPDDIEAQVNSLTDDLKSSLAFDEFTTIGDEVAADTGDDQ